MKCESTPISSGAPSHLLTFSAVSAVSVAPYDPGIYTSSMPEPEVEIRRGYTPGAIGRVVELCSTYYHDNWGFGLFFEAKVAADLAEFLSRYEPARDGFWTAWVNGRIEGHISIDGRHAADKGAHLRYFIVSDALRGRGIGNRLMEAAMSFCRGAGHKRVFLWTFEGLHAARHLYEKYGFRLAEQRPGSQWSKEVNEQRLVMTCDEEIADCP